MTPAQWIKWRKDYLKAQSILDAAEAREAELREFAETCCGKCTGGTCYVDGETGA